jgi:putative Ig domain-containing protein
MCVASLRKPSPFLLWVPLLGLLAFLHGCASASRSNQDPPPAESITITTTSLPSGQINLAYSTTLAATGGTSPLTWTLTSGALPTGLQLNASTGAIAGTPTVSVTNSPLTIQVKDSSTPQQTKSVSLTLTIAPTTLTITTTSLPSGQINVAYSTTLAATGGTSPFTWTLTSGTLPTGLQLNASTGAIAGTPTVSVTNSPLTLQVKDSSTPQQTKSVNLTLTIGSGSKISVSISPKRGGVMVNHPLSLTATVTNDIGSAGVNWSVTTGGTLSAQTTSSTSLSATTAGVYTVTAKSNADGSKTASVVIGVTDLKGVTTYHNNLSRDGTNTEEYALTPTNVTTTTFGKLYSCAIDSPAYAQPLWVANLSIGGGVHNVVFVATSRDTVYAFDADKGPCVTYWSVSLLGAGETYLNSGDVSSADIEPDIGIVGTPVIDLSSSTLYVVSKSKDSGTSCTPSSSCHQRLHALNLGDHAEKFGGPYELTSSITVPGNGDGSSNGQVPFNPLRQNQRPGLVLVNGLVYITWASHGDNGPYHGWVIGFTANNIGAGPAAVWNSTPTAVSGSPSSGGIWMSGGAPAADSSNNLYFLTGNGAFNADAGGSDYGDSTVKLSTSGGLHVTDYFTPENQSSLNSGDLDHGSGGAAILVDQPSGPVQHLLIGGGKQGTLFLVNRDNMGHFNSTSNNVVQSFDKGRSIFATGAFWNNFLYMAGMSDYMNQYTFNTGTGQFGTTATHHSACCYYFPGATPSVSSLGPSTNGIVWALDNSNYCTTQSPGCGPTVLHAYDATNVSTELWNSTQGSGNSAGNAVKFTVPTVANGKVYVPTRSELDVFGLLPN